MRMGEVAVSSEGKGMEAELKTEERSRKDDGSSSSAEVVRWERFLPRMVLRVLLVEADDSTRQIITALLRKCSYRVAAVPDGLKAWETLKGRPHNIDLILTELDLPSISGYALLALVMEHDICKNIPVIMMSSQGSISMVLKCMLKGAADFLIKPVRKNELKNLWQHVWRRQALTAGAGDVLESGNNVVHKVEATSENNGASNHSSSCRASKEENKESCDEGSDAQGFSWFKRRNPNLSEHDESLKLGGQSVVHKRVREDKANRLKSDVVRCNETCNSSDMRLLTGHACARTTTTQKGHNGTEYCNGNARITQEAHGCNKELTEFSNGAIDLISSFDDHPQSTYGHSSFVDEKETLEYAPQLELSLRRYCPSSERDALNHSDSSPFSRYDNSKVLPYPSFRPADTCEFKEDESRSCQILSKRHFDSSNGNSFTVDNDQENMTNSCFGQFCQAEMSFPAHQQGLVHASKANVDHLAPSHTHVCSPMFYQQASLSQAWSSREASAGKSTLINSNPEICSSEQVGHWTDETLSNTVDQTLYDWEKLKPEEQVRHGSTADAQTGGSLYSGVEDNTKSSVSESNHKEHGTATMDGMAEKVTTPESLNEDSSLFTPDGSSSMGSRFPSQREAALMKFRLKRKDRCFEKKVRYQSRKRLAEQRPRVKGQFIRQVHTHPAINISNPSSSNS